MCRAARFREALVANEAIPLFRDGDSAHHGAFTINPRRVLEQATAASAWVFAVIAPCPGPNMATSSGNWPAPDWSLTMSHDLLLAQARDLSLAACRGSGHFVPIGWRIRCPAKRGAR